MSLKVIDGNALESKFVKQKMIFLNTILFLLVTVTCQEHRMGQQHLEMEQTNSNSGLKAIVIGGTGAIGKVLMQIDFVVFVYIV